MTSSGWDDSDYPYHPRYTTAPAAPRAGARAARWQFPWRAVLRWAKRAALATAGILVLALALAAIFGHRIISNAMLVAQLEDRGCDLTYVHQLPGEPDSLHPLVRRAVGDGVWSEVAELSCQGHMAWWSHNREDVELVCQSIRRLPQLRSLTLVSESVSWDLIKDLPQLGQLERLELGSSSLTDEDLKDIGSLQKLKSLKLTSPNLTMAGAAGLGSLADLETLELNSLKGTPADSPSRTGFANLKKLVIKDASLDDDAIVGLGPLPLLAEVELSQANLSDRGLAPLLVSPALQSVILNDVMELDGEESALIRCPGPAIFHLPGTSLTDASLQALAGRSLNSLVLDGSQVTDAGLETIGQISDLRYLSLRDTQVSGTGAKFLAGVKDLTQLDLRGAPLTAAGAAALARTKVAELVLANTPLNDEQLLLFAENYRLSRLDITSTQVTAEGLRAFYEARKKRLQTVARLEYLLIDTDHPQVTAEYVDPSLLMPGLADDFGVSDYGF